MFVGFHAMSQRSNRTAAHIRDPLEWLRLTVDSNANNKTTDATFGPFSWARTAQPQL